LSAARHQTGAQNAPFIPQIRRNRHPCLENGVGRRALVGSELFFYAAVECLFSSGSLRGVEKNLSPAETPTADFAIPHSGRRETPFHAMSESSFRGVGTAPVRFPVSGL
jgi:hypothetical protein